MANAHKWGVNRQNPVRLLKVKIAQCVHLSMPLSQDDNGVIFRPPATDFLRAIRYRTLAFRAFQARNPFRGVFAHSWAYHSKKCTERPNSARNGGGKDTITHAQAGK